MNRTDSRHSDYYSDLPTYKSLREVKDARRARQLFARHAKKVRKVFAARYASQKQAEAEQKRIAELKRIAAITKKRLEKANESD